MTSATRNSTTRPLARVAAILRRLATLLSNRSAVRRLTELDDRTLKDIGLMRADVSAALAEPLYRDASERLILSSGSRRDEVLAAARADLRRRAGAPLEATANGCLPRAA